MSGKRIPAEIEGTGSRLWWIPFTLQDIDRRRFTHRTNEQPDKDGNLTTRWEFYSLTKYAWEPVEHPESIIKHIYDDSEAYLGHGRGLVEPLFYYHWAKTLALGEGLAGLERWAQGMIIVKVNNALDASDLDPNTTIAQAWADELEKHRARHILVVDKEDDVTTVNMSGQGHQIVTSFLTYLDDSMIQLILGALRPMGEGEGGARAQSETESDTVNDVINFDRELLSETITNDLVGLICDRNKSNFAMLGIDQLHKPFFKIGQDKRPDPAEAVTVITGALQAQIPLLKNEVYDRIGFTPPVDGDEVIEPAVAQAGFGIPGIGSIDPITGVERPLPEVPIGPQSIEQKLIEDVDFQGLSLLLERAKRNQDLELTNIIREKIATALGVKISPLTSLPGPTGAQISAEKRVEQEI